MMYSHVSFHVSFTEEPGHHELTLSSQNSGHNKQLRTQMQSKNVLKGSKKKASAERMPWKTLVSQYGRPKRPIHPMEARMRYSISKDEEMDRKLHIVFSTDCSAYQDWQTLVIFHSAHVVGQLGSLTRIASGCDEERQGNLTRLYDRLWPRENDPWLPKSVHFTPDFSRTKTGERYEFYNKPYGVVHFLTESKLVSKDAIVAIIDPDFVFVRPLSRRIEGRSDMTVHNPYPRKLPAQTFEYIDKGRPVAQLYGLGAPWTNDAHKKFGRTRICGEGSPCLKITDNEGHLHYAVGPPYILHYDDILRLSRTWTKIVPKVYEKYPFLLAEMYAYCMAAAHEELPHLTIRSFMVSNTECGPDEGWPLIDKLGDDTCRAPTKESRGIYYPGKDLPTFVHYCQWFRIGEIGFQKRRVTNVKPFSCKGALLVDVPADQNKLQYFISDGHKRKVGRQAANWNHFALCVVHNSINAAAVDFKRRMCIDPDYPPVFDKTHNGAAFDDWDQKYKEDWRDPFWD